MNGKVLIVDDDEGIIDALSLILEDEGFTVKTVNKGEQAIEQVEKFKPNVLLLDLLMSGYDGRDICKQLKQDPQTQTVPVIMISAHPSARQGALDAGADDFLAKPFETSELLERITHWAKRTLVAK